MWKSLGSDARKVLADTRRAMELNAALKMAPAAGGGLSPDRYPQVDRRWSDLQAHAACPQIRGDAVI